jgi:hypothetical protein
VTLAAADHSPRDNLGEIITVTVANVADAGTDIE